MACATEERKIEAFHIRPNGERIRVDDGGGLTWCLTHGRPHRVCLLRGDEDE